jgi:hypothetical protein
MSAAFLNQYGPWVLLTFGVIGLLNTTLFYGSWMRLSEWLLAPDRMEKLAKHNPMVKGMGPIANRAMRSPVMWWMGLVQSVALLIGAAVWFSMRP